MNTYKKRQVSLLIVFLIVLLIGILSLTAGLNNEKKISLKYRENNDVDYKVYLKENNFFEQPYIEKGKTYITSLIDYIDVTFSYNIDFDKIINGIAKYKVVAKIEANKSDNQMGNYWTKEYDITEEVKEKITNRQNFSINQTVKIDYNKYNELLNDFKKTVGLTNSEGILQVYLKVNEEIQREEIETPIEGNLILKLPLSQLAIEASIDDNISNNIKEISETVKDNSPKYILLNGIGAASITLAIILLLIILRNAKIYRINNKYELELKKILNTYDSIIVNVKDKPNMNDYNVIRVESFEELIDAHSEIRMPINYFDAENGSLFVLFNDNTAWEYILYRGRIKRSARR